MIHSFDIFDTCLFRSCGKPKYVFDILGAKILHKSSIDEDVKYFSLIRTQGELTARKNHPTREITLDEIYSFCDFSNLTSISKEIIMEMELQIESDTLYANGEIRKRIDELHTKGKQVAFISDMYLSANFLKGILIREGLFHKGDHLFVSCEVGITKSCGGLFKYVCDQLKIRTFQLYHTGDNLHSDFLIPLRMGVIAKLYKKQMFHYEKNIISMHTSPSFDYNYICANICNGIINTSKNCNELFAADFIAPIMVPFVYNILIDAKTKGINALYFLARDAFLPYSIAKDLHTLFPDIELKYLYVSRQSLYFPSMSKIQADNREEFISRFDKISSSQIIDYLQLDSLLGKIDVDTDKQELFDEIFETDKYQELEDRRIEQLKLITEYFKQEGLANNEKRNAIVDVRGTLRTQQSINKILKAGGFNIVTGYYFEVQENRLLTMGKSEYNAILDRERYVENEEYKVFNRATDIIEQYFGITNQQRTKSYKSTENGSVVPEFENNDFENYDFKNKLMNINIEISKRFTEKYKTSGLIYVNPIEIINSTIYVFCKFLKNPQRHYVDALYNVIASQNKYEYKYIVSNISYKNIINKRIQWYEGSFKRCYGNIGLITFKVCNKILKILKLIRASSLRVF